MFELEINETSFIEFLQKMKWKEDLSILGHNKTILQEIDRIFIESINQLENDFNNCKEDEIISLFKYDIPKRIQSDEFLCSKEKDEKPFNLLEQLFHISQKELFTITNIHLAKKIYLLNKIINKLKTIIQSEWLGIYQNINNCLYKLCYYGKFSRADFPITEKHAKVSTNSFVGLNGCFVKWDNINSLDLNDPYYTCDSRVESECCVPIYDKQNLNVIGIIDSEAHSKSYFTIERQLMIIRSCYLLRYLL
ncbi:hypothetical protein ABK040_007141 [Willaertia magna]